ncbi:tyrosine-type recombinase/integrase [Vannielia litorea]|uniref:tyrosine-type recombinase/integrase n=1 Tax=Vannielia litorea TaxID=1217970 RepID=UPI001C97F29D|nr:site-specific integrase [Vannielia litorea]MBY6048317.1 integrase arm-type DNA-binding domain-containing protein [Vannielia litorea]MBY6075731.1 integrase arm-type DNA-binding domain-containing protein [Vannielia litorea]
MTNALHRLTAQQVKNAAPGTGLSDGGGLSLRTTDGGHKRWVFRYKMKGQTQREMGLGSYPGTTLAQAREKASAARELKAQGIDPIADGERRALEAREESKAAAGRVSFGTYADEKFLPWKTRNFTNAKHIYQWERTFRHHASPLRDKQLSDITRAEVLDVLLPIWDEQHETAKRTRGRIEALFDHAIQTGAYGRDNPARAALFSATLSAPRKLTKGHLPAMPWRDVPVFVERLRHRPALSALALEFLILTAARSGEVREATWSEIDWSLGLWTVPAGRQKTRRDTKRRDHVVPLTKRTISILKEVQPLRDSAVPGCDFIFPGSGGRPLSDMAFRALMNRMDVTGCVPHGFRSSFRDWAGSATEFPRELAEEALAHALGDVESAYRREQSVERRRKMMEAWEAFLDGAAHVRGASNIVLIRPMPAS